MWGMFLPSWVWPLSIGVACAAVWLAAAHGLTALARWLRRRPERLLRALSTWRWGRLTSAISAATIFDAAVIYGAFAAADVGLRPLDWATVGQWLPGTIGILTLWLALLWGAAWRKESGPLPIAVSLGWASGWDFPSHFVFHEASLAIFRGTFAPALGRYWGAWLAVGLKWALGLLAPGGFAALQNIHHRPWALLGASLDGVSTAVFIASGNLWAGGIARLAGFLGALVAFHWARHLTLSQAASHPSHFQERPRDENTT